MAVDIQVKDVGAVVEFEYQLSGPGLHILKGKQGAGKTTVLRAVELAVDGRCDVRPQKRDGATRGEAIIAGHTIRISKQVRTEGELSIEGLGDLSIAELHSPKFDRAETRDKHRIRSLVKLAGVKADASLFRTLLPDWFDEVVPSDSLRTDDLVDMAARVKRAIESEALRVEKREETAQANARAQAAIAEGVDVEVEHDEHVLQNALETAMQAYAAANAEWKGLERRARDAVDTATRAEDARNKLQQIGGGTTVSDAEEVFRAADTELEGVAKVLERLEAKLREANEAFRASQARFDAAGAALNAARREEALHIELHAAIDAAKDLTAPTKEDFDRVSANELSARNALSAAKSAITQGATVRAAIAATEASAVHLEKAKRLAIEARTLRGAAQDTQNILTQSISQIDGCPLSVRLSEAGDPRLVIATDRSDEEYFDELSDGERWQVVVGIAAKANRLIVLPQAAFGELAPSTRMQLHALAQRNSCYILSAVADDCELHGEAYEQSSEARSAAE